MRLSDGSYVGFGDGVRIKGTLDNFIISENRSEFHIRDIKTIEPATIPGIAVSFDNICEHIGQYVNIQGKINPLSSHGTKYLQEINKDRLLKVIYGGEIGVGNTVSFASYVYETIPKEFWDVPDPAGTIAGCYLIYVKRMVVVNP